jgi:hypothetical protein
LTQFAVVFAALIHDVDHTGPNTTLKRRLLLQCTTARVLRNKTQSTLLGLSSWILNFDELRATIYSDDINLEHFRQLVVNSVMAIIIMGQGGQRLSLVPSGTKPSKTPTEVDSSITGLMYQPQGDDRY